MFANYINTYSSPMASKNVDENTVLNLLTEISSAAQSLRGSVASGENKELLDQITASCEEYNKVVERAYQNVNSGNAVS